MCIHDFGDYFIKAWTTWYDGVATPMEAEALGLKKLFFWLAELEMSSVSIQLDCKLVIDGIMDNSTNQTEFGIIVNNSNMLHFNYPNFTENSKKLKLGHQNYIAVVACDQRNYITLLFKKYI